MKPYYEHAGITNGLKSFAVFFRYKTRPRYRTGRWKSTEKVFAAHDLAEALRLAKAYAETNYGAQWVVDVCHERKACGNRYVGMKWTCVLPFGHEGDCDYHAT